ALCLCLLCPARTLFPYTTLFRSDWARLTHAAHTAGATAFVTTEKDEQNLQGRDFGEWSVYIAVIALAVSPEPAFDEEVRKSNYRSEEHTSELQSHLNLVCRLLLE